MELVAAAPESLDLRPYREFVRLAHGFEGYVTNLALDPTINPYRSSRSLPPTICRRCRGKSPEYLRPPIRHPYPTMGEDKYPTEFDTATRNFIASKEDDSKDEYRQARNCDDTRALFLEEQLRKQLHSRPPPRPPTLCHRCRRPGHIRCNCKTVMRTPRHAYHRAKGLSCHHK